MKKEYKISGMHCASCAKMIEMELEDKVNKISVSSEKRIAEIDFDSDEISDKEIVKIISDLGYKVN